MIARVFSSVVLGIEAHKVEVEVDISRGLPSFSTVGLPEGAVRESKERVKAAINNSGYKFPMNKITVNLAPANIRKEGAGFDLPIAIGILEAMGVVRAERIKDYIILGELSLDARIKSVPGGLPVAFLAEKEGFKGVILPTVNSGEASIVNGIEVIPADNLPDIVRFLNGEIDILPVRVNVKSLFQVKNVYEVDFREVRGQEHVKRALEIAAAGGHNLLMVGPPGAGKTMIARRLPTILPPLTIDEAIETTKIYSILGMVSPDRPLITQRPFRFPHHTISDAGLIGGGHIPRPGEVSLAHNGVLFLDELPEFRKNVIEVLRQPMEDGEVTISRAQLSLTYPSRFMLVSAMNPCPCGYLTDPTKECRCSISQIQRYKTKISGPLLDRIDIQVEVPPIKYQDLSNEGKSESSEDIRKRVVKARSIQEKRYRSLGFFTNSQITPKYLRKFCKLDKNSEMLLESAMERLSLSARAYSRILKIARTICDLSEEDYIKEHHIAEAIQYRVLDKNLMV